MNKLFPKQMERKQISCFSPIRLNTTAERASKYLHAQFIFASYSRWLGYHSTNTSWNIFVGMSG